VSVSAVEEERPTRSDTLRFAAENAVGAGLVAVTLWTAAAALGVPGLIRPEVAGASAATAGGGITLALDELARWWA
jgi:hypothetical protein